MRIKAILSVILISILAISFASCSKRRGEPGSKSNPIRFYFMPLRDDDVFAKNSQVIKNFIENNSGLVVNPINSPDFLTIINAFANGQADVAFMNTLGYLMARDMTKAEAHLLTIYGDVYKTYRGEIISRVDGSINAPTDIAGKTIAFADPFSASGYLYALKFLRDHNIRPSKMVFAGSHKKAIELVYRGEVNAAATYHNRPSPMGSEQDARTELLSKYPDIMTKVKIVALTDEIPNGPVAFRRDLPDAIKTKLVGALVEFSRTEEGRKTLGDLYNVTGLSIANDSDYDAVQDVIKKLGKNVEETVPGGITFYNTKVVGAVLGN